MAIGIGRSTRIGDAVTELWMMYHISSSLVILALLLNYGGVGW